MATTLTVWKFNTAEGAEHALQIVRISPRYQNVSVNSLGH
ncbi:MAG: hypothetical protein N5P05_003705 [Chroococcopsis gigantea SAG 12.99]|jgi:hypothetical protein|nr:hypothetical protein [Chroococcopsis gigantea SAG 12.99]